MSQYGLSGAEVSALKNKYAGYTNRAANSRNFSPPLLYAVAYRETIHGELVGLWPSALTVVSGDGGHGLFQLTSSYPAAWEDPLINALYAIDVFLKPAIDYWHGLQNYSGDDLVRLVAATFNAGLGGAEKGHAAGDVDKYTTDHYAAAVLTYYHNLVEKGTPE